ncbi:MAG TPA: biotin/lipoyl-binding protein [Actinocrinis sp.]
MKSLRGKTGLNVSLGVVLLGGIALAVVVVGPNRPASNSVSNMATVAKGTVLAQVNANGDLSLQQSEALSFAAAGTVTQINVSVGEQVSSGQTLATIDQTLAQDQVTEAQDALSAAQDALQADESGPTAEQQTLDSDKIDADEIAITDAQTALANAESNQCTGSTSTNCATIEQIDQDQTALDDAESALQTAEDQQSVDEQVAPATVSKDQEAVDAAQVALAQAQSAEAGTVITAPTNGTVLAINGFVGSQVTAGASGSGTSGTSGGGSSNTETGTSGAAPNASGPFITMSNLSNLQVTATLGESAAAAVQVNQSATVSVTAIPGMVLPAQVAAITPTSPLSTSSSAPVQYAVTLDLTGNVPTTVRDGEAVDINITTGEASKTTYVPNTAVTTSGGKSTVTVVGSNGRQTVVPVTVGLVGTTDTQIIKGVNEGEQVLVTIPGTSSGRGLGGIGGSASSGPAAGAPVVGRVG